MNCINCGARLTKMDQEYCPHCGFNVQLQRKVEYLSKYYYNQGLEKASIRDLSGAISCLKQSLAYNKNNIQARNLLGLVYFETGEVVAALSEWVISKNLQPRRNLAAEYIEKLQANSNKLEIINETIKKYNHALLLCREGHEDMAAIQLKKILTQNPKLIKGYHLLALISMKNHDWNRARRILKKAARIDKTNTTTLRFLKEVDEQTGVTTRLERRKRGLFGKVSVVQTIDDGIGDSETLVQPMPYRERSQVPLFFMLLFGMAVGALAFWLLVVPGIRQGIYRQANEQIMKYSESLSSQGAELSRAQDEAEASGTTAEAATQELAAEQQRADSYQYLLEAYQAYVQSDLDSAAIAIQNVYRSSLETDAAKSLYYTICDQTGVSGPEDTGTSDEENFDGDEYFDYEEESYSDYDSYDEYDYDDSYDDYDNYDDYSEY